MWTLWPIPNKLSKKFTGPWGLTYTESQLRPVLEIITSAGPEMKSQSGVSSMFARCMKNVLPFCQHLGWCHGGRQGAPGSSCISEHASLSLHRPLFEVSWDLILVGLFLCVSFWYARCWASSRREFWDGSAALSGHLVVPCGASIVPARFISSGSTPCESRHTILKPHITLNRRK